MSGGERPIPLVDLKWQHAQIASEVAAGFERVFENTAFVLGPAVGEFEEEFAAFCRVRHCIGVGSGTDALELALRGCGVEAGDEVVLPAHTFIATALAVLRAGAVPVLADVDDATLLLDPEAVAPRIGPRTRFLMPVHLYGQMAPMAPLEALADARGLTIVEDAAQSQGATQDGRSAGSVGRAAGTSFFPGKNIGAYGDGGAVLTDDDDVARHVRHLRNWGSERKYHHPEIGFNSRLDTLQAVVLRAKLARLGEWNAMRVAQAERYDAALEGMPLRRVAVAPGNASVFHLYVVRLESEALRDRVLEALGAAGIGAGIHYPVPMHLHGALAGLGHRRGDFPVAERACAEMLSLPIHPGLADADQQRVVDVLGAALRP